MKNNLSRVPLVDRYDLVDLAKIANGWLHVFEQNETIEAALLNAGHDTFKCFQRSLDKFTASEAEHHIHQRCFVEDRKALASSSPVLSYHPRECRAEFYKSEYLESLRFELARSSGFADTKALREKFRPPDWRSEPDPVLRERGRRMLEDGPIAAQQSSMKLQLVIANRLKGEALRFQSEEATPFVGDWRFDVFRRASNRHLGKLGFAPVTTTLSGYAALELNLKQKSVLRWAIGEDNDLYTTNSPAIFLPVLSFRDGRFRRKLRNATSETRYLEFPVAETVEGFRQAYLRCSTAAEVEAAVAAYAVVIEAALPAIRQAIDNVGK